MQKARQATFPKTPKNVTEITDAFENEHIRAEFGTTIRKDESKKTAFFKGAISSDNYSACVFASDDIVKAIETTSEPHERLLSSDATFDITPMGIFNQVLIIFAAIYGCVSRF